MKLCKTSVGNDSIWYDGDLLGPCDARIFDPDWLRQSGALTGSSTGRNQAFFLRHQGREMVLRHFWRGGLIGKINPDLYLRQSVAQSRAMREMMLLDWMRERGLPVPQPVAARFSPVGLFYRADIITLRLQDTRTLAEVLRDYALAPPLWAEVGAVIARMHEAGVDHSDLNCRNILLQNGGKIWLIDFDKCEGRGPGPWAQENLARLKRSFEKEKTKVAELYWQDADWSALIAGYQNGVEPALAIRPSTMEPTLLLRSLMGLTMLFPGLPGHMARRAHIRQGGDPARLTERFGVSSLSRPEGGLIWIHAASVGEVVSISSLVRLIAARTDLTILMTTTTMTGAKAVTSHLPGVLHQFLPIDTPKAVAEFLAHWRPALACFVEGDLWPRLLFSLYQQGVPVALLNARPSKTRTRAPRSFAALLGEISLVTVQATALLQEFRDLGIAPDRVHAPGNLKADMLPMNVDPEKVDRLREARPGGGVWAAVSTHPGEEEIVLKAHAALQGKPLLILAPRHPARGDDLAELLRRRRLVFTRHSLNEMPESGTQVHLLDALGELGAVYAVADMALIGGSLVPGPGGHTPYEAAQLDCAMLSGPHVRNFQMAYDALVEKGAVRIVQDAPDLVSKLDALLAAPRMLEEMRLAARVNQAQHTGAVERSFALLAPFLSTAGVNASPRGDAVQP